MPREPFLTRVGLGRSPFLPTPSITRSPHYFQVAAGEEIPHDILHPNDGRYIQIYDKRGRPINPLAEKFARQYRHALNEIMAATGVVEKCPPPSANLPGSTEEQYNEIERDLKWTWWLSNMFDIGRLLSIWWIQTIGGRICTFDFPHSMPLADIIVSEYQFSGPRIFYAGLSVRAFSFLIGFVYSRMEQYRPAERMLRWMRVPRTARAWASRFSRISLYVTHMVVCLVYCSIFRLESLQRLDLLPATKMLPSWNSVLQQSNPFPLVPSELHPTIPVFLELAKAVLASPTALLFLFAPRINWVQHVAEGTLMPIIASPEDMTPQSLWSRRFNVDASQNARAHRVLRDVADRMLRVLGWRCYGPADVEISGTVVGNLQPLLPGARPQDHLLPGAGTGPYPSDRFGRPLSHRVTLLSTLPARTVATACARFVARLARLPFSVVIYRLIAGQYLSLAGGHLPAGRPKYGLLEPLAEFRSMDMRSLGILLSRLALLEGLGLAIDLSLFFCQWGLATYVGKKHFGWGNPERGGGEWDYVVLGRYVQPQRLS